MSLFNWNGMNQVCVVGSHDADLGLAARLLSTILRSIPDSVVIATRETSGIDTFVVAHCEALERPFVAYGARSYKSGWERDTELVSHSDGVVAIFSPASIMAGGTSHVVSEATRLNKPCVAFTYNAVGMPIVVGTWERPGVGPDVIFEIEEVAADA